jgi:peptidyl-prolyl cis-trans isomerase C
MHPLSLRRLAVTASVAGLFAVTGCNKSPGGGAPVNFRHNKTGEGTPVATFNQDSITAEELKERFAQMSPFARARYQTAEQRKDYVEGLARFELLAQEALSRGLQNDPDVVETAKKVMVQKLIQSEFDDKSKNPISDDEVAKYYDQHKSDYVKPELIRLSHIFLAAPNGDSSRTGKKMKAEQLLKEARGLQPLDYAGFGKLVEANSEEEKTKALRGDMRYLSDDELASQYGGEVATAAKALATIGQVSDVVETPKGFHVLKLQGRQAALNLGVDQVKAQIESRLAYERRTENFNKFVEELKKKSNLKFQDETLAKMELDLKAPAKDNKAQPPGFIPPANPGVGSQAGR